MSPLRLTLQSVQRQGISQTTNKIWRRLNNRLNRLPIYITYVKLWCLVALLKREKLRTTRILGYRVVNQDIKSLFIEFKDIFKNRIYHFTSKNQKPTIIDGGGSIGMATLYFKYCFPTAQVTIFEPSPIALPLLKKNIELNNLENVTIVPAGLGRKEKTVFFNLNRTYSGQVNEEGDVEVPIKKLSHYLDEPIDYLKLNIEGNELDVLHELEDSGRFEHIHQLCFEWHSFASMAQNLNDCLNILRAQGYRYLINHFDHQTNPAVRPPFSITERTQYYLLVYAQKTS